MQDDDLEELREVIERARDLGPLMNFTSPLTPKEMIVAVVQMPESELPVAARHELVRLVELEEARVYRDGFSGEWKVWQALTWEQTERNEDSRRWLHQWVADFQS